MTEENENSNTYKELQGLRKERDRLLKLYRQDWNRESFAQRLEHSSMAARIKELERKIRVEHGVYN